jgi:lipopolysaccharide export system permease protein
MTGLAGAPRIRRLRLSPTLTGYIARQFLTRIVAFLLALAGIIALANLIDLLDRFAVKTDASLWLILEMALLRLPFVAQEVMPFAVLFAGMATFWRLTRSHEMVVTRAAGISVWQSLLPVLVIALLLGGFTVTVVNPISASLLGRFERLESRHLKDQTNVLTVSRNGLWLRQSDGSGQAIIHAAQAAAQTMTLERVIVFRFGEGDRLESRIDAARATLLPGMWRLEEARVAEVDGEIRRHQKFDLPTELTAAKVLEGFSAPETVSFWKLPAYIALLERSGLSPRRHLLHYNRLIAMPLFFSAMILFAAIFALRPPRRGRVALTILAGLGVGFVIYALSNFVFALGLSARIPLALAAWAPAGISALLGAAILFHLEDG